MTLFIKHPVSKAGQPIPLKFINSGLFKRS